MTNKNLEQPPKKDPGIEKTKGPDFNTEDKEKEGEKTRAEQFEEKKPEVSEKIDEEVDGLSDEEIKKELEERGLSVDMRSKNQNREQLKQVKLGRAETMAGLRDKLDEFKQSRQRFVEAEKNLKKYQGLKGALKMGGDAEASVQEEYDQASAEYEEKRAEYVGEKVNRMLGQQTELVKTRAENFDKEKGFGKKFYEGYKKLGKWNLGALLGDEIMGKLDKKEDDGKAKRFLKGTARFLTKTLSVRMAISTGLLGAGIALGGGIGFVGALAARRIMSGIGAGFGTYDLMKMFGTRKEKTKGMKKELSKEELKDIEESEIIERLSHFQQEAEDSGDPKTLNSETYKNLKIEFNSRAREDKIKNTAQELIANTDESLEKVKGEARKKELKRKGIATGVAIFMGSGAFGEALKATTGFVGDVIPDNAKDAIISAKDGIKEFLKARPDDIANLRVGDLFPESSVDLEIDMEKQLLGEIEEYSIGPMTETGGGFQGFDHLIVPDALSESSQEVYDNLKNIISGAEGPTIVRGQAMDTLNQLKTAAPEQWEEILENHGKEIVPSEQGPELEVTDEKIPETPDKTKIIPSEEDVLEQPGKKTESPWDITTPEDINQDTFNELQKTIEENADPTQAKLDALVALENLEKSDPERYQEMIDSYKGVLEEQRDEIVKDLTEELTAPHELQLTQEEFITKLKELHPDVDEGLLTKGLKVSEDGIITRDGYTGTYTMEDSGDLVYSGGTGPEDAEFGPKILKSGVKAWEDYTPVPETPVPVEPVEPVESVEPVEPVEEVDPVKPVEPIQEPTTFKPLSESDWTQPSIETNQDTFNKLQKIIEENADPTVARLDALGALEELEKSNPEKFQELTDAYKESLEPGGGAEEAFEPSLTLKEDFVNRITEAHPEIDPSFADAYEMDENGVFTKEGYTGTYDLKGNGDLVYSGGTGPKGTEMGSKILKSGVKNWEDYTPVPETPATEAPEDIIPQEPVVEGTTFKPLPESDWTQPSIETNQDTFNELQKIIEENAEPTQARLDALNSLKELEKIDPEKFQEMTDAYKASLMAEQAAIVEDLESLAKEPVSIAEHLDYQGGKTVWDEVDNQLQERMGFKDIFTEGDEAERTHAIDYFKDRIEGNPEEYGLDKDIDFRELSEEDFKKIDWDKLLSLEEGEIDIAFPDLTEEARQNIIENNKILQEYVSKTGEGLEKDTVNQILEDVKAAGSVDEYLHPTPEAVEAVVEPESINLSEMRDNPEYDMTPEEEKLLENIDVYTETDVSGRAARKAQEAAAEFLDKQDPEVYNKYPDIKDSIQNIRIDNLNEELNEGKGLFKFGRPDTEDLMTDVQKLARIVDMPEKEANLFSNWLAGEDGILKKNDFADLMTKKEFDETKFLEKVRVFNEIINSEEVPDTLAWEPRHIYIGDAGNRVEQLVNMRAVEGGYEIDTTGDGIPEGAVHPGKEAKELMNKEAITWPKKV